MIHFHKPYVESDGDKAVLRCEVEIDDTKNTIWFSVEKKYRQYLCNERTDAYVIAVLNYAMRNNHDIICDAPISEDLYYNLDKYLIDAIVRYNSSWHRPQIIANIASEPLPCAGAVGTGISCGVDSFHVLAAQTGLKFKHHNVTHLAFNNVGSHGEGVRAAQLYTTRLERPRKFAKEYGFEFIANNSNLQDVIKQTHFKTHTYSSIFAVYCLQKLYSIYYYASAGYKYSEFTLEDRNCCGSYEILSLPLLSTQKLKIYSEGADLSRIEKLQIVAAYEPSYSYLNVCLNEKYNCCKCEKCIRTLLELDAIGVLDKYQEVFDVKYYRNNKHWYLVQLLKGMHDGRHDYFEIYPYFKKEITLLMRVQIIPYIMESFLKRFIPRDSRLFKILKSYKFQKGKY